MTKMSKPSKTKKHTGSDKAPSYDFFNTGEFTRVEGRWTHSVWTVDAIRNNLAEYQAEMNDRLKALYAVEIVPFSLNMTRAQSPIRSYWEPGHAMRWAWLNKVSTSDFVEFTRGWMDRIVGWYGYNFWNRLYDAARYQDNLYPIDDAWAKEFVARWEREFA